MNLLGSKKAIEFKFNILYLRAPEKKLLTLNST